MTTTKPEKLRMECQISIFSWKSKDLATMVPNSGMELSSSCPCQKGLAMAPPGHVLIWFAPPYEQLSSIRISQQSSEKQGKVKTSWLRSFRASFYHLRVGHLDPDHHLWFMLWLLSHLDVLDFTSYTQKEVGFMARKIKVSEKKEIIPLGDGILWWPQAQIWK